MKTVMLTILAATLVAQHQHPASKPVKPATLTAGLGKHHHPISTTSPLAQKFFDQGLVLVYGFIMIETVNQHQSLVEKLLCQRAGGGDRVMMLAEPRRQCRRFDRLRGRVLVLCNQGGGEDRQHDSFHKKKYLILFGVPGNAIGEVVYYLRLVARHFVIRRLEQLV